MKKILLFTFCLGLVASTVYGQGTVAFANTINAQTHITNAVTGAKVATTAGLLNYGLFVGTAGTSSNSLDLATSPSSVAAVVGNSTTAAGRFDGGANYQIGGYAASASVAIQVRAWSASFGNDWLTASTTPGALYGVSRVATLNLGPSSGPGTVLFNPTDPLKLTGFSVYQVVPEPSTIALGLMGLGATLVLIRRRK
jgi:hypothetical protein